MKRVLLIALLLLQTILLCAVSVDSGSTAFDEIRADSNKRAGLDGLYPMREVALTPAPRGYEPFYISHYGRHGSRYAFTDKVYLDPMSLLNRASAEGNITEEGRRLLDTLNACWPRLKYRIGELTPLGWNQQQYIGRTMVSSFPTVFGKGSIVDACSSPVGRAVMSMAACCMEIARSAPRVSLYAHQGLSDIPATVPDSEENPFRPEGVSAEAPFPLTADELMSLRFPGYRQVLGRLFIDVDKAVEGVSAARTLYWLNLIQEGRRSVPEGQKEAFFDTLMNDEEQNGYWEVANYIQYCSYFKSKGDCKAVVRDIIRKAENRITEGFTGADLRFGHDHTLLATLMDINLNGMGTIVPDAFDVPQWFRNYSCPMAGNVQFVFYRPKRGRCDTILFKVLLNGEEARLSDLQPLYGPYYKWPDFVSRFRDI